MKSLLFLFLLLTAAYDSGITLRRVGGQWRIWLAHPLTFWAQVVGACAVLLLVTLA